MNLLLQTKYINLSGASQHQRNRYILIQQQILLLYAKVTALRCKAAESIL